ncbi:hypothetical protein [Streptomyces ipomoeae]|uniref:hypothetical protein n=1 Tax=Streptomyces ipomoeae TaxID=103232 RepID=UPI001FD2A7B5|nr:hypothetical protein [Streptomyces ipomoeae]MDX2931403.1 hypothetical protein [Streptomyces ipomoeae]
MPRRVTELSPDARDRLLDDVEGETDELGRLVDELVEPALARDREEAEEPVDLAALARRAAQRAHRRTGRFVLLDVDESWSGPHPRARTGGGQPAGERRQARRRRR